MLEAFVKKFRQVRFRHFGVKRDNFVMNSVTGDLHLLSINERLVKKVEKVGIGVPGFPCTPTGIESS